MKPLKYGSKGEDVAILQRALNKLGGGLSEDGDFGVKTEAALLAYQAANGLLADGIYGRDTAAAMAGEDTSQRLKAADIQAAAELLQVDAATIKAVVQVESAGSGYLKDGRVKILFERHIFYRELVKRHGKAIAERWRAEAQHVCSPQPGGYKGGTGEYPRLARAMSIDAEAGMSAASWGLFQIMGFNHAAAGFADIHGFVDNMEHSEGKQLLAFAAFVRAHKTMHAALQKREWAKFAAAYNGPAYQRNNYDSKLANAYARYAGK